MTKAVGHPSYALYHEFVKTFEGQGFQGIDADHSTVRKVEEQLRSKRQYMHVADLVKLQVLYRSDTCRDLFGLDPQEINIGTFFARAHPDDLARFSLIRAKSLHIANELFIRKEGSVLQSTIVRQPDASGVPRRTLFQAHFFPSKRPVDTVYVQLVLTDLSGMRSPAHAFHHYLGDDLALFRYPDEDLLRKGLNFSEREFEVLKLIAQRMESDEIAKRLFLSVNTVNTHRRNILRKTGTSSTHDLVIELKEQGLL